MKKRRWIRQVWFDALFRLSRGRSIHGVDVVVVLPNDELLEKVRVALDLVATYAPCSLLRLRRYGGILVQGTRRRGAWIRDAAVVKFGKGYVASDSTHPAQLAGAIVRESARAQLEYSRLDWALEGWRRIGVIGLRTEARFAARLSGGDELAPYGVDLARRIVGASSEEWENEGLGDRYRTSLQALDPPAWLLPVRGTLPSKEGAIEAPEK